MKTPKIESVMPKEGHVLVITFSDGTRKAYDITPLLEWEMFATLNNQSFFKECFCRAWWLRYFLEL